MKKMKKKDTYTQQIDAYKRARRGRQRVEVMVVTATEGKEHKYKAQSAVLAAFGKSLGHPVPFLPQTVQPQIRCCFLSDLSEVDCTAKVT